MNGGLLCLKWRDHHSTFFRMLSSVRKKEMYCDATIACEGRFYPVHKLVLSTCSEYFERMFDVADKQHLMIVLADIPYENLETLLDFMYIGEVNVLQSDLSNFMKAAECLKIKGLAEPTETNPRKECVDSKRNLSQKDDGKRNLFQKDDGKRNLSQKDDGWETKRRRQNDDLLLNSRSETKTNEGILHDSSGSSKGLLGSKESCIESKRGRDQASGHGKINNISTLGIVSPAQLASAELASETQADSGSKSAAPLAKSHESSISHDGELTDCNSSQVKFEDVNVKEEPEEWLQTDSNEESQLFKFSDPGLTYMANTSTLPLSAQGLGQVVQSHVGALEHSAHPLPGPSGLHSTPGWDHQLHSTLTSDDFVQYQCGPVKGASQIEQEEQEELLKKETRVEGLHRWWRQVAPAGRPTRDKLNRDLFLTTREVDFLIDWLKISTDLGFAHVKSDILNTVQKIFVEKQRKTPFKNNLPNSFWYYRFLKNNPNITSIVHKENQIFKSFATFNAVEFWYSDLENFLAKLSFQDILNDATRIFSTGSLVFPMNAKDGTVFEPRSKNDRTPSERSQFISVIETISAAGKVSPATVICPDLIIPSHVPESATLEWHVSSSPSGALQAENFLDHLKTVFIPWLHKEGIKTPVILFLHGRYTSMVTPEVCELFKEKKVFVHSLHPYTVLLKLEPVVMAVCDPLTLSWAEEVQKWKSETNSQVLTCSGFFVVLSRVQRKAMVSDNIKQAFQLSGLSPFSLKALADTTQS
ncbi:uncharacterized protein [Procambarus clarkii]|uniref:uncharacterized protein isoform X2 n=1 Tax=Procambarus clarkii TaxID=6728 RepID=UPI001E6718F6|nr:uncharacterized protein LOC123765801 isoform X2 [Procambarus clarkii]